MEGYLRGYYGYKNFGDELLFFGVVKRLFTKYPLTKLFVEVDNVQRMEDRVRENYKELLTEKQLTKIKFIDTKQHIYKFITHLINFLGRGKYKKVFKFFGGGEVLSDERPFPHDGRNIPLLFNYSVKKGQFALLGGIGKIRKPWTERLYNYLLPKAESIVVRDTNSYTTIKEIITHHQGSIIHEKLKSGEKQKLHVMENIILHQDFAQETLLRYKDKSTRYEETKPSFTSHHPHPYILININKQSADTENIDKIVQFCQKYPDHKKIFFPCDMNDDNDCFLPIKKHITDLEVYDRTKHSLSESLSLFYNSDGGIGARLHFLLPLKLYDKPIVAIPYADKINKLIISPKTKV